MKTRNVVLTIALGGMLISVPATIPSVLAADNKSDPSLYSDRDPQSLRRMKLRN